MSDIQTEVPVQGAEEQAPVSNAITMVAEVNPFDSDSWKDTPVIQEAPEVKEETIPATPPVETQPAAPETSSDEEVIDSDIYLEQNFGWKNTSDGIKELTELRKLTQFSNEDSKKLYEAIAGGKEEEVYALQHKKRELSQLDQLKAEEVIRMNIRYNNPHYKSADVEDVFEDQYSKPAKPIQSEDEEDVDYSVRVQKWQQQVDKIDRKIERDAFAAKEHLAKYKNELVLPDIPKQEQVQNTGIDPEVLEQFKQYRESVLQKLPDSIKSFDGFNVTYKDKEVELPITYAVADEEKSSIVQFVKDEILGEHFNVNDFFGKRWFDENGMPTKTLYEDAYYFRNKDKVHQKFVNEAISKIQEYNLRVKSNINVTAQSQGTFNLKSQQTELAKMAATFFAL